MNRTLPTISESAAELKTQLQQEPQSLKRQRLHMLYLLASGQAQSRQRVAELLGLHRNTIGRWLTTYETEGLAALLAVKSPPGAVPLLNPEQKTALRAVLAESEGFASYGAVQDWLVKNLNVQMSYSALHKLLHYKWGAKLKVARPSHLKKNAAQIAQFQQSLEQELVACLPAAPAAGNLPLPVTVWAMDESRFGLQTSKRRRLTLRGVKPVGIYQHRFKNFYVYGIVAPQSGEGYFETRLSMATVDFQGFLAHFTAKYPERFPIILLDNAGSHHAKARELPTNVALLHLPPYAPELNPCERVWQAIKDKLAWLNFTDLVLLQDALAAQFETYDEAAFATLVAYPYLCEPVRSLAA